MNIDMNMLANLMKMMNSKNSNPPKQTEKKGNVSAFVIQNGIGERVDYNNDNKGNLSSMLQGFGDTNPMLNMLSNMNTTDFNQMLPLLMSMMNTKPNNINSQSSGQNSASNNTNSNNENDRLSSKQNINSNDEFKSQTIEKDKPYEINNQSNTTSTNNNCKYGNLSSVENVDKNFDTYIESSLVENDDNYCQSHTIDIDNYCKEDSKIKTQDGVFSPLAFAGYDVVCTLCKLYLLCKSNS